MKFTIFLLLSLISSQAFGLSLEECFQAALKHNETVGTAEEGVVQADETVKQAWGSLSPVISFQDSNQWQQPANVQSPFFPNYQPQSYINASQPLLQGFREWAGLSAARKKLSSARYNKENNDLLIYKQVVAGYYGILNLERDIQNLTENSKYLNDRIRDLNRWLRIGRAQKTDVLLARSNLAANEVMLENDRSQLAAARDQFALLTDLPVDTTLRDDTNGFKPKFQSLDEYLDRIKVRPDVRAAMDNSASAKDSIDVAKADHGPSLSLNGDYYFQRPVFMEGSWWDARIELTMPIFTGGVTQSKVRQAYSVARQADLAESLAKRTADQEIRSFYDMVASDLKQFQLNQQNVELSDANFKEELKSFRLGLVTNLDVLTALTSYITAKRSYDANRFNLKMHFLTLQAAAALLKTMD